MLKAKQTLSIAAILVATVALGFVTQLPLQAVEEKISWSPWVASSDKKISVRFGSTQRHYTANQPTKLCLAIRNDSDKTIDIIAPWGDTFQALSSGLKVTRDNAAVKYQGPMKEYVLGTSSFCKIEPKKLIEQCRDLSTSSIQLDLSKPGKYSVGFSFYSPAKTYFSMGGNFKAMTNPWEGTVEIEPIIFDRSTRP